MVILLKVVSNVMSGVDAAVSRGIAGRTPRISRRRKSITATPRFPLFSAVTDVAVTMSPRAMTPHPSLSDAVIPVRVAVELCEATTVRPLFSTSSRLSVSTTPFSDAEKSVTVSSVSLNAIAAQPMRPFLSVLVSVMRTTPVSGQGSSAVSYPVPLFGASLMRISAIPSLTTAGSISGAYVSIPASIEGRSSVLVGTARIPR